MNPASIQLLIHVSLSLKTYILYMYNAGSNKITVFKTESNKTDHVSSK